MKIKNLKHAAEVYASLHQFYRDQLSKAGKSAGSFERLSVNIGVGRGVARTAIVRDNFRGLQKLVERL